MPAWADQRSDWNSLYTAKYITCYRKPMMIYCQQKTSVTSQIKRGIAMNFFELAKKRYSCRHYQAKPVEDEKLSLILEAGRICPTAANKQPNRFIVVNSHEAIVKLEKGTSIHHAPLAIIVCANVDEAWVRPFDQSNMSEIDSSIATDHMMMAATDLGLGTCWITYFDPAIISYEFHIELPYQPINILAIGYADNQYQGNNRTRTTRKSLEDIVSYDSF